VPKTAYQAINDPVTLEQMPLTATGDPMLDALGELHNAIPPAQRSWTTYGDLGSFITGLNRENNFRAADDALKLTPQEQNLYGIHLHNLYGAGGVDNPDGSRSTIKNITIEADGAHYVIPTVWDGAIVDEATAIANARQYGLEQFPSYGSDDEAQARYDAMHDYMDKDVQQYFKGGSR
jgi:hypothetical protein